MVTDLWVFFFNQYLRLKHSEQQSKYISADSFWEKDSISTSRFSGCGPNRLSLKFLLTHCMSENTPFSPIYTRPSQMIFLPYLQ